MISVTCPSCFMAYAIPEKMYSERKKDHESIYCPSGHGWHYTALSDEEKMRLERDRLKQQLARKDDEILAEKLAKEKVERKLRRVQKGVCPCCTRSFANLARHMQTKHPELPKPKLVASKA